ncbi:eukaryotic translation initiation factor eIF2A-domain-containing protein [Lasiosphaeria miniovina]|uniref:Eukaryotic translation initiation factor 2A n=1 Tax=Lasiosphaeria miniovina TaxID=1954250 RepID=A0AA40AC65_9PEZI|nr:eukaryotic translation initiation factor eIF2A-domain-containing protein [Lasiosphaeria miniovina]KAK0713020.1 eukaryotic translation initiation factor eIF2A-domain-containing protein [Lasiosphaeria miniovina]
MASPLQFAYRTQKAIGVFDAAPVYEDLPGFDKPEGNLRCCVYSPCGRYFAYASNEGVSIVDASVGHVLTSLLIPTVYDLSFSPRGSYLSTWERPAKDENGDATKNLKIWRVIEDVEEGAEKQPLGKFVQKSMTNWNLQYTADEQFCARLVTNEVQFYQSDDLTTVWNKLRAEGVTDFAIAPGMNQNVAVFVPERKGQPAGVKVFNVPQFATPISQKTFFKGDKVQLKWNALGTNLIVLAQTEVDKSNKSYYGETNMYLLSANGSFDARVTLDKEGPIHDVAWSPNSKEFAVTYGFTPAKTTLFNHRAVVTHSFPLAPRNTLIFSPTGRFVLVAGFGNLAGQIDVYDLEKDYRKVTTIESGNPSVCTWSPDSRYILTATTSPRLRVDNGVKLWHVTGGIMYNEEMVELYNVMWRPAPLESLPSGDALHPVPAPHASALAYLGTVKTPSKPAGAYRPPGARGTVTPLHFKREDEGGAAHIVGNGTPSVGPNGFGRPRRQIPGAEFTDAPAGVPGAVLAEGAAMEGEEGLSKTALKNKKKRNKKAKEGAAAPQGAEGGLAPPPREFGSGSGNEGRSPERRGQFQNQNPYAHQNQHMRNQSRNLPRDRARSHSRPGPQNGQTPNEAPPQSSPLKEQGSAPVTPVAPVSPVVEVVDPAVAANQSANAKKIRSLQKKIRAIEDLEMRYAGGEKLEDTQMKKIKTKVDVMKELDVLAKELA